MSPPSCDGARKLAIGELLGFRDCLHKQAGQRPVFDPGAFGINPGVAFTFVRIPHLNLNLRETIGADHKQHRPHRCQHHGVGGRAKVRDSQQHGPHSIDSIRKRID